MTEELYTPGGRLYHSSDLPSEKSTFKCFACDWTGNGLAVLAQWCSATQMVEHYCPECGFVVMEVE
jgi:hypothetical protein